MLKSILGKKTETTTEVTPPCPCVQQKPPLEMKQPGSYLRENGILMLTKEFNQENIMPLVASIYEYNLMPEELQPEEITLIINSPGGSVHSAFHLIDTMQMSDIPVVTVGKGMIASCGVLTIMAGDTRTVSPTASIMSHQYSWGSRGKEHELQAKVKEFDMAAERMLEHYKKYTKKNERYIRKHLLGPTDVWPTLSHQTEG